MREPEANWKRDKENYKRIGWDLNIERREKGEKETEAEYSSEKYLFTLERARKGRTHSRHCVYDE